MKKNSSWMTPQMLIFSKTMNLNLQRPNEEKKQSLKVRPREGNKINQLMR